MFTAGNTNVFQGVTEMLHHREMSSLAICRSEKQCLEFNFALSFVHEAINSNAVGYEVGVVSVFLGD